MMYPCEWHASSDLTVASGTATFMVDGVKYTLRLDNFAAFQAVSKMLEVTFQQGKVFGAGAVRSHVVRALDNAEIVHGLI